MTKRILIPIALVLVLASGAFLLFREQSAEAFEITPGVHDIAPDTYQAEFIEAERPHLLLDVRTPEEHVNDGHIAESVNIAVEELEARLNEIPNTGEPIVVYCNSGRRSAIAVGILQQAGYPVLYDLGGIQTWIAQGLPVE